MQLKKQERGVSYPVPFLRLALPVLPPSSSTNALLTHVLEVSLRLELGRIIGGGVSVGVPLPRSLRKRKGLNALNVLILYC